MKNEQKFFVYVDYREDDGRPFYVGKGLNKRVRKEKRNPLHANIKNKHGMVRKIVFETYSEQEAFDKEIELIQELKTHIDFDEGGANLSLGGGGISGYKYSEEQRKKMSEANKKKWEDPEYREKMKQRNKKMWENPEHKKLVSESMKKTWEDPEIRGKIKAILNSPEFKEKMSKSCKKAWEIRRLKKLQQES